MAVPTPDPSTDRPSARVTVKVDGVALPGAPYVSSLCIEHRVNEISRAEVVLTGADIPDDAALVPA